MTYCSLSIKIYTLKILIVLTIGGHVVIMSQFKDTLYKLFEPMMKIEFYQNLLVNLDGYDCNCDIKKVSY